MRIGSFIRPACWLCMSELLAGSTWIYSSLGDHLWPIENNTKGGHMVQPCDGHRVAGIYQALGAT